MNPLDIDPRFAAAHYQDGRDLRGDAQQPSVHSAAGDLLPSSAVRTGDEGWLPPAPIPQDERAAFEQWWKGDEFVNKFYAWSAWQARAQLGAVSVPAETASGARPQNEHAHPVIGVVLPSQSVRIGGEGWTEPAVTIPTRIARGALEAIEAGANAWVVMNVDYVKEQLRAALAGGEGEKL